MVLVSYYYIIILNELYNYLKIINRINFNKYQNITFYN